MGTQQFCLRWNNHQVNLLAVFDQLLQNEAFVDVTLACEGLSIKAHKMVLSACSPYFQALFIDNPCQHPIVILKDVRFAELKAVVDFMYKGEVNVSQDQLQALLKTAETLKVKGLAEVTGNTSAAAAAEKVAANLASGSGGASGSTAATSGQQGGQTGNNGDGSGGSGGSGGGRGSPPPKRKRGRPSKRPSQDGGDTEVVESLVDVVPDGPDSVPTTQERNTESKSDQITDQSNQQDHNMNADMAYDGIQQDHGSNSRDSGLMMGDTGPQSSSSSSLGQQQQQQPQQQIPATASTSGMSPGQEILPVTDKMPRTIRRWTYNDMSAAIEAVRSGQVGIKMASRIYNIPTMTLWRWTQKVGVSSAFVPRNRERTRGLVPSNPVLPDHAVVDTSATPAVVVDWSGGEVKTSLMEA